MPVRFAIFEFEFGDVHLAPEETIALRDEHGYWVLPASLERKTCNGSAMQRLISVPFWNLSPSHLHRSILDESASPAYIHNQQFNRPGICFPIRFPIVSVPRDLILHQTYTADDHFRPKLGYQGTIRNISLFFDSFQSAEHEFTLTPHLVYLLPDIAERPYGYGDTSNAHGNEQVISQNSPVNPVFRYRHGREFADCYGLLRSRRRFSLRTLSAQRDG